MVDAPALAIGPMAKEMPDFIYFECLDCGFDSVQKDDFSGSDACPLCEGDSGHFVRMTQRTARADDRPEGRDARKEVANG